jgi:SAM-dependent methyltransferase
LRLNLGSGDHRAEGWLNIDQWKGPGCSPDLRAEAVRLPFADGAIEAVYCGHLLEHLSYDDELPVVLAEIRRVLDGPACFVGPDCDRAKANPEWHDVLPSLVDGGNRWPGDQHQWYSTGPKTLEALRPLFPDAHEVSLDSLGGWPLVCDVGYQFAILTEGAQ